MGKRHASVWLVFLSLFLTEASASPACSVLDRLRSIETTSKAFGSASTANEQARLAKKLEAELEQIGAYDFVLPAFNDHQSALQSYVERRRTVIALFNAGYLEVATEVLGRSRNQTDADTIFLLHRKQSCDENQNGSDTSSAGSGTTSGGSGSWASKAPGRIDRSPSKVTGGSTSVIPARQRTLIILGVAIGAFFGHRLWKRYQHRQRRRTKRYPCLVDVKLRAGKNRYDSRMHDVSQIGGKFTTPASFEIGFALSVLIQGEWITGKVRWGNDHYFGIEFSKPLSAEQMAQLTKRKRWFQVARS